MPEEWKPFALKKEQLLEEASKIFNALPIREAYALRRLGA
jgi:hypothetical protein